MTPTLAQKIPVPARTLVGHSTVLRTHPTLFLAGFLTVALIVLSVMFASNLGAALSIASVLPAVVWAWGLPMRGALAVALGFAVWNGVAATTLHHEPILDWLMRGGIPGNVAIGAITMTVAWLRGTRKALERELTARLEAQRSLAELSVRSASILTSVDDGVVAIGVGGGISAVNPAAEVMLGRTAAELSGTDVLDLVNLDVNDPDTDAAPSAHPVHDIATDETASASMRGVIRRADGEQTIVDCRINTLKNPLSGGSLGTVMTLRDITDQERLERARDEFLAITSHELRTPLTAIQGAVKLANASTQGTLPETTSGLLDIAIRNSDRVLALVNQIIDLERMKLGHLDLDIERCSAMEIADEVALELTTVAADAGVWVQVAGSGTVEFEGDRPRLLQVLTNAVGNAIKFAPSGSPVTIAYGRAANAVRFEISDHGRGIPNEQVERVFEPFSQVEREDETIFGGTGLGLAIARGIVKEHGGRIWIESDEGKGTSVMILLPLRQTA